MPPNKTADGVWCCWGADPSTWSTLVSASPYVLGTCMNNNSGSCSHGFFLLTPSPRPGSSVSKWFFFSPAARAYVVFPKSPWKPLTVHQYCSTWAPATGESASRVSTGCIQAGMSSVEILLPVVLVLGDTVEGLLHLCLTTRKWSIFELRSPWPPPAGRALKMHKTEEEPECWHVDMQTCVALFLQEPN